MGARALLGSLLIVCLWPGAAAAEGEATPAPPPDRPAPEEPSRIGLGIEGGVWVDALLDLHVVVGGSAAATLGLSEVDGRDDLGLEPRVEIPYARIAFDSRYVTLRAEYWVGRYTGSATVQRQLAFGGITFTTNAPTDTDLNLHGAIVTAQGNILNNDYVCLGGLLGVRGIVYDVHVETDLDADGTIDQEEQESGLFPLPLVGIDLLGRLGDVLEVGGRVSGFDLGLFNTNEIDGSYIELEAYLTVYPLAPFGFPYVGLRASYLRYDYDVTLHDADRSNQVTMDATLSGILFTGVLSF